MDQIKNFVHEEYRLLEKKEAVLYALSIGFSKDPFDLKELEYTYELHENFKPF